MDWLLIIFIAASPQPGAPPAMQRVEAGLMVSEQICLLAGHGMARSIMAANPSAVAAVSCIRTRAT